MWSKTAEQERNEKILTSSLSLPTLYNETLNNKKGIQQAKN